MISAKTLGVALLLVGLLGVIKLRKELHRILHRLPASEAYWRLLAVPRDIIASD
jgi:hypothetical protein